MKIRTESREVGGNFVAIAEKTCGNCQEHMEELFVDVKDFVRDMQDVTEKELLEAKRLIKKLPQRPLVKSDANRPMILREFIGLIDELDDIPIKDVEKWITHFKTEAY